MCSINPIHKNTPLIHVAHFWRQICFLVASPSQRSTFLPTSSRFGLVYNSLSLTLTPNRRHHRRRRLSVSLWSSDCSTQRGAATNTHWLCWPLPFGCTRWSLSDLLALMCTYLPTVSGRLGPACIRAFSEAAGRLQTTDDEALILTAIITVPPKTSTQQQRHCRDGTVSICWVSTAVFSQPGQTMLADGLDGRHWC